MLCGSAFILIDNCCKDVFVFLTSRQSVESNSEVQAIKMQLNCYVCLWQSNGEQNGSVEFAARWQLAYKPPPGVLKDEPLYEDEAQEVASIIKKPPMTPKK